ncbi:siderophore ferric iron reductase [uncultured Deefgea sp.]|uniref:siderophore ferric iron reductase n=1 Tax=uncultured Deefgea sp. TaxID=1304914 RepID=UPI0026061D81|nr:siderophore ferric iron reductase [uncultured Deefgea sp.]
MVQSALEQIANSFPALRGQFGNARGEQTQLAQQLLTHWQQAQPLAGPAYWRARSWGMLIWQPAYLAVFAVHQAHTAINLDGLWQAEQAGITNGFTLSTQPLAQGMPSDIIHAAAQSLLRYHQQQYAHLNALTPYSAHQAACLTVDCVLSALMLVFPEHEADHPALTKASEQWLTALQWLRHGNLMPISLPDDRCVPALKRQGCCQHFRLPQQEACSTCPRWPMPIRIEKIRQELLSP